jgi:hypothetical protein
MTRNSICLALQGFTVQTRLPFPLSKYLPNLVNICSSLLNGVNNTNLSYDPILEKLSPLMLFPFFCFNYSLPAPFLRCQPSS